jgi:hypothetical protein
MFLANGNLMKKIFFLVFSTLLPPIFGAPPDPNKVPENVQQYLDPQRDPQEVLQDTFPQGVNPPAGGPERTTLSEARSAAQAQAIYWLSLIDQRQYPASYSQAGSIFRAVISSSIWNAAMESLRGPKGNVRSRSVNGTKKTTNLGGLQGDFITINFSTKFSKGGDIAEAVTLSSQGGQWKVVSYQIGN